MEEGKAAAYYEELTRKGGAAARFKQGLGFSAASDTGNVPARGSALPSSSSSFLSNFVKASSPSKASELVKQAQLESIQNKLKKTKEKEKRSPSRDDEERDQARVSRRGDRHISRRRSRSRERGRDRHSSRRSRSRERYRDRRRRSRSRSRSDSDGDRRRRERRRSRSSSPRNRRAERRSRSRSRSRSSSPRERRRAERRRSRSSSPRDRKSERERKVRKERNGGVDYSRLIEGYDKMSPAERIKAKTKLQLAETVEKDATKGSSGWERFEFNKDAPLDDEEIEAAEDDTALVKHISQSFRYSAVEAKREEQIRAAHDEAIFGVPVVLPSTATDDEPEPEPDPDPEAEPENKTDKKESNGSDLAASLLSEKVLAKQQGSWRDRARRQRN